VVTDLQQHVQGRTKSSRSGEKNQRSEPADKPTGQASGKPAKPGRKESSPVIIRGEATAVAELSEIGDSLRRF
jgi:hypothetical protein